MLCANGIEAVTTTVKNPQSNAICEQPHQSYRASLQTMLHRHLPDKINPINDIMDSCIDTAAYASKVAIHCTLNMPPGA